SPHRSRVHRFVLSGREWTSDNSSDRLLTDDGTRAACQNEDSVRRPLKQIALLLVVALLATACAAGRAFRQGERAMAAGNLDQAVAFYRRAVQEDPDNPGYKIALERAMLASSRAHFDRARQFESDNQLEAARGEYQLASEYDPSNRTAAAKVAAL